MNWKQLALEQAVLIKQLQARIVELEAEVAALKKNSSNSSKQPSSDIVKPPKDKPPVDPKTQRKVKRKRGGQKGHKQNLRKPLAPELIDEIVKLELSRCPECGHKLDLVQGETKVTQQIDDLPSRRLPSASNGSRVVASASYAALHMRLFVMLRCLRENISEQRERVVGNERQLIRQSGYGLKGIKRHFLVDVLGLILFVVVHTANIQERAGAKLVLAKAAEAGLPRLETVLADDGYSGRPMREYVFEQHGWRFVSVKRTELHQFKVMPKRWVVERTIGWMNNFRGLSKHYDDHCKTGESKILFASIFYMTKRLTTPQATPKWSTENEVKFKNTTKASTN